MFDWLYLALRATEGVCAIWGMVTDALCDGSFFDLVVKYSAPLSWIMRCVRSILIEFMLIWTDLNGWVLPGPTSALAEAGTGKRPS